MAIEDSNGRKLSEEEFNRYLSGSETRDLDERSRYVGNLVPAVANLKQRLEDDGLNARLTWSDGNKPVGFLSPENESDETIRNLVDSGYNYNLDVLDGLGMFYIDFDSNNPAISFVEYSEDDGFGSINDDRYRMVESEIRKIVPDKRLAFSRRFRTTSPSMGFNVLMRSLVKSDDYKRTMFNENEHFVFPDFESALRYSESDELYNNIAVRSEMKAKHFEKLKNGLGQIVRFLANNDYVMGAYVNTVLKDGRRIDISGLSNYPDLVDETITTLKGIDPDFSLFEEFNLSDYRPNLDHTLRDRLETRLNQRIEMCDIYGDRLR